MKMIFW